MNVLQGTLRNHGLNLCLLVLLWRVLSLCLSLSDVGLLLATWLLLILHDVLLRRLELTLVINRLLSVM